MTKNIRILDCTLRDGGRIIDCAFPDEEITALISRLSAAKVDIIETGFLRDHHSVTYRGNSTFFTNPEQIRPFLNKTGNAPLYVAFIDYGMFDFNSLPPCDGSSIDGIRFGFTKDNYFHHRTDIMRCVSTIKEKGYRLFIQGVNSLNYKDREILDLVDMMNEVHPYSFGVVDTYGAMYMDDVDRLFALVDNNLDRDISIDFHSHNNYQLSFAFAQEVIKLSRGTRQIILDATLAGMGKVAGNLNTELIMDYLVRKLYYDYDIEEIFDAIDNYISKYELKHRWGYSIPGMLAGTYKSHPNNVIYLMEKFRLNTGDIKHLLSMIDPQKRQRYDYDNIEQLYMEYIADKIDDHENMLRLKQLLEQREVLVMVPGSSLNVYYDEISRFIAEHHPFVISVNFVADDPSAWAFYGNQKRYHMNARKRTGRRVIITSNIRSDTPGDMIVNYHSLINRGYRYFENSTIMLLNLLKKMEPSCISIAGFDGFRKEQPDNYMELSFQNERHKPEFDTLNREIEEMFAAVVRTLEGKCRICFITPSRFETVLKQNGG